MAEAPSGPGARWLANVRTRGLSTRVYLVAFVVALIGPGLLFTSVLLERYGASERARFEQDAREVAQQAAASVDRDTEGLIAALRTLAAAAPLRTGDIPGFEARMRALAARSGLDLTLRRPDGAIVAATALQPGAPLPISPQPFDQSVVSRRAAIVSDALPEVVPGRLPSYTVAIPVIAEGAVDYILSARVPTERLLPVLLGEVSPGWSVGVIDRAGTVLAQTSRNADLAGRPAIPLLRGYLNRPGSVFEGKDDRRLPMLFATARVPAAGWSIGASVSQSVVDARVTRWVWAFAGFGLLTLAVSSFFAVRLWALVSTPLRQLAASGDGLSRGLAVPPVTTPVREIRQLGDVLTSASADLRANMEARDRALREQALGLTALRESEARFRHMADSAPALIWMTNEKAEVVFINLHFEHVFGRSSAEMADAGWRSIVHPDDLDALLRDFMEAFEARQPYRTEMRALDHHGRIRWLRCESVPRLDDTGRFLGYTGCGIDITDIKAAETALRTSEERLRLALEAGRLGIWELDLRNGERHLSPRSAEILDTDAQRVIPRGRWIEFIHPDDQARLDAEFQTLLAGGGEYDVEFRVTDRDGEIRWIGSQAIVEHREDGAPHRVVGIHQDVTARKRAEEHQRLLIHELNHRVKNTLATVQSIAIQALRPIRGKEADVARDALESRLIALARTHDILTRERWESAELGEVVTQATAPHAASDGPRRFTISGPRRRLPPRIALSIAMALHELGTNAVKYGALSVPEGGVSIEWGVLDGGHLVLTWQESGGPTVVPPTRSGFGSRLIERNLARELDGTVELRFEASGVVCTIRAPLPSEAPPPDPAAESEIRPAPALAPRRVGQRRRRVRGAPMRVD